MSELRNQKKRIALLGQIYALEQQMKSSCQAIAGHKATIDNTSAASDAFGATAAIFDQFLQLVSLKASLQSIKDNEIGVLSTDEQAAFGEDFDAILAANVVEDGSLSEPIRTQIQSLINGMVTKANAASGLLSI